MVKLEHKDHGELGSEFILKHKRLKWTRFYIALFLLPVTAGLIDLYSQEPVYLWMVVLVLIFILILRLYTKVNEEKLLILPTLGLQIQTKYSLGTMATEFMEISQVDDVIINEAIRPYNVIFYMAVLLRGEKSQKIQRIQPLFIHSWPKLDLLKEIYCAIQSKLFITENLKSS